MNTLHTQLQDLATKFASQVLSAIRTASLDDLTDGSPRPNGHTNGHVNGRTNGHAASSAAGSRARTTKSGRLARRSTEEIKKTLTLVVAALKSKKDGMRAEEIRKSLNLDVREVPRVLKEGLSSKLLRSRGEKRATTYFVK
jgi:hypothetical protein